MHPFRRPEQPMNVILQAESVQQFVMLPLGFPVVVGMASEVTVMSTLAE